MRLLIEMIGAFSLILVLWSVLSAIAIWVYHKVDPDD